jgi:hypothetical protein
MIIKINQEHSNIFSLFFKRLNQFGWSGTIDVNNNVNNNNNVIKLINSFSFETLEKYIEKNQFMDYHLVEQMIVHLGSQMNILSNNGLGFLVFNMKDISIIDGEYFIFNNLDNVCSLNKKEELICNYPIEKKSMFVFVCPELKSINSLPIIANVSCSYYSFALLCVKCLGLENIESIEHKLSNTRMYFFLKRCLDPNPDKRYFLYL